MPTSFASVATIASQNSNVQSINDFWLFLVYCLVVIVVVIFFLFYFNRVLGQILTFLVNQYTWRKYNAYIEVDSIRVSLLGGRILFKNLRYLSTNQSVSIVKGHLAMRYWLFNVRKTEDDKSDKNSSLPCRVVCSIEGLEWFIYNNSPVYNRMRNILGLSTVETNDSNIPSSEQENSRNANTRETTLDPESQNPINNVNNSLMERLMPIQFEVMTGAVMIGNMDLKSMMVWKMSQASGIYSLTKSRSSLDYYKSVFDFVLRKPQISLKDNMDFTNAVNEHAAKTIPKNRWLSYLLKPWRLFHPLTRTRQYGEMQHMQGVTREGSEAEMEEESTSYHEEYARVGTIVECSEMAMTFYSDYAGPVPTPEASNAHSIGLDIGNGGMPPEWGIRVSLWDAVINYGPWADRQRSEIQDYFFPNSHRNNTPTAKLVPGQQRTAVAFETYIEFMNTGNIQVPTREISKDWKYSSGLAELDIEPDGFFSRPYGWVSIKAGEGSYVKIITPYVIGPNGSTSSLDVVLKDSDITTSVNYASFVKSDRIEIQIKMPAPLQWNGFREWEVKISPKKPTVFLLRDHVYLLQDMVKDWISGPSPDLLHFIPTTYTINFNLEKPTIYLYVNEHNVITDPDSMEENAFLKVEAHKLTANITLPFTKFQPETTAIKFFITAEHGSAGLSLQTSHTMDAFMREEDSHAAVAVSLTVDGTYEAYNTVDVLRHIESCNLHIKINGATVKLFGTLIRYLFLLKDNYFGSCNHFSTIDEYRKRKSNEPEWLEQKKRQTASKPVSDPFEVYLLLELDDGVLLLPENLYECSRFSQFEFQELQVELRNLDVYLDLYVNVSPITLSRDSNRNQQSREGFFRIKNARDPKNYVYIDGINITAHRLFGPVPDCLTYLCHWEFDIGKISGEIKPSFLFGLATFAQSFSYNLIDEDNAVPQEMEAKTLPDVTFLKLYVQQVDVYLMSVNSATNICLQDGILVELDNLINEKYSQRITIKIPSILARCLANPAQSSGVITTLEAEDEYSWVEVAKVDLGLNITIFRHTAMWKKARSDQQSFIRIQDYATRRCVRLYEDTDSVSQSSQSSLRSIDDHHVGFVYAPPFRPFMFGRAEDKSILHDNGSYVGIETPTPNSPGRYRGYSDPSSMSSSNHPASVHNTFYSSSDTDSEYEMDGRDYDASSVRSGASNAASFYTAKESDDDRDYAYSSIDDEYSDFGVDSSVDGSFIEQLEQNENGQNSAPDKHVTAAIPPSIPYSDYLRRYKVYRSNSEFEYGGFFHPFIPPSRPHFIPEKDYEEKGRPFYANTSDKKRDYFSNENAGTQDTDDNTGNTEESNKRNEVIATTLIEATRPVIILVTPILVKIVQELAEEIIKDDWDLETMLDSLQVEYISQLSRYLTHQYICTRFAVILPQTYLHFIQNVTVPDDLPSYKHGESFVKTQYNPEETMLCSADIFLNDFQMIGSVKFEDLAFKEKEIKVVESDIVLQESRVHIDVGDMGSTVQYISKQHEVQPIAFGIPYNNLRNKKLYANIDDEGALVTELVMLDLAIKEFSFKWLGARNPNYAEMSVKNIDTIIITESVEVLVGAVYSWLVFVDDLKGILESFHDQRSRQVQVFTNALADYSIGPGVAGDPIFLTTPITLLRLGSRNFRIDIGWKLLARLRHCLRSMPLSAREELQYRLTSGNALQGIDSEIMFTNVVQNFSKWRNWEFGEEDIANCRLFTHLFKQKPIVNDMVIKNPTLEAVAFLTSSSNFAKLRLGEFKFTIYEEETVDMCKEENSISIKPFEFLAECMFKSSPIATAPEPSNNNNSNDGLRKSYAVADGYLDIVTNISVGDIHVSANPIILAFARHMLLVQRVFTAKLRNLSYATKPIAPTPSISNISNDPNLPSSSAAAVVAENSVPQELTFDALLSAVDIVAQALVSVDSINFVAHAQDLRMDAITSGIQGSALFSNPKLAPLQLVSSLGDRDSESGSGRRSSNRAARKNAYSEPRLVVEAAGGINSIDIQFKELRHKDNQNYSVLLAILLERANLNVNLSQIAKSPKKLSSKEVFNAFFNIHRFYIHAPQSLLRLYGFVESWQTEQGRRYHFMIQNLMKEWEEQRREAASNVSNTPATPVASSSSNKMDIKLQFLLNEFLIQADLLPSLTTEYRILDFFAMVNQTHHKSVPVYAYAVQLSKQVVHLITKDSKRVKHERSNGNVSTFSIPGIRSTGSLRSETITGVDQLKLRSMISVDIISMSLDASLIDSLLTAQSLLGNEVSEFVEVISYSGRNKPTANTENSGSTSAVTNTSNRIFKYAVDVSLDGLHVSAASPSAIGMFRSHTLEASISNDNDTINTTSVAADQLTWKLQVKDFSLSLDHNTVKSADSTESFDENDPIRRPNCLAYILMDFTVQNYLPSCTDDQCQKETHIHGDISGFDPIFIEFSRIQTVMQPIALGKLAEMYIYYDSELRKKKLMKKEELDQLSANTKRIVQSITAKNEWPKALQEETHTLLDGKIISLHIRRLGVAIPLSTQQPDTSIIERSKGVGALLFSVSSIEFMSKNIERGTLQLDNLALQFVKKFDQNKAEHFIAENHPRMNQVSLPSISCHVSSTNIKPLQSLKINAQVKGFEIDVDGTIADYINTLSIIYVKSMDRVNAFTSEANFNKPSSSSSSTSKQSTPAIESPSAFELVHLDVECKFECDSSIIRMYPKRYADDIYKKKNNNPLHIRTGYNNRGVEGNMATVEIPGLSACMVYQTPLGAHAAIDTTPKRLHTDILIYESKNILHPSLVQFLHEVVTGLKLGMQQSSERKADRDTHVQSEPNLNASLFLCLSKTQLDLSCQPSSKVVCSLGWEESEFLMNSFSNDSTSRSISCVGSVRAITAMAKHYFSPEACLNARIDRVLFNVMLTSQRKGGGSSDDISIVIELPAIVGHIDMRHLQDLLILNSCWFGQSFASEGQSKPTSSSLTSPLHSTKYFQSPQNKPTSGEGSSSTDNVIKNQELAINSAHPPAPFSKHLALSIKQMSFSVDMGQNIGKITLAPNNFTVQLHHIPFETKGLNIYLDEFNVTSEGRLSGGAKFKRAIVQARVDQSNTAHQSKEKVSLCARSEGLAATFEYEYQNILDTIMQSLELNVDLQKVDDQYDLQTSINLESLIARLSIKTVPVIITMMQKFNELIQRKKMEAGIKPDLKASSSKTVAAASSFDVHAIKNTGTYETSSVRSYLSLCVQAIEVVIYPSQLQDSDNIDIRAKQFKVALEALPRNDENAHRVLLITLISAALTKNVPGKELMEKYSVPSTAPVPTPKNLGGTKIFGIPGTEIKMESTQLERHITHEFDADFAGRVSVSLNIGLIRYLQEMISMFNLQLDRALEKDSDKHHLFGDPGTPASVSSNFEDGDDQSISNTGSRKMSLASIDTPISSRRRRDSTQSPHNTQPPPIPENVSTLVGTENLNEEIVAAPAEKYEYTALHPVNFQPQLEQMGDATPSVDWFGLKKESIPGLVHENITLHLDQLTKLIWEICNLKPITKT